MAWIRLSILFLVFLVGCNETKSSNCLDPSTTPSCSPCQNFGMIEGETFAVPTITHSATYTWNIDLIDSNLYISFVEGTGIFLSQNTPNYTGSITFLNIESDLISNEYIADTLIDNSVKAIRISSNSFSYSIQTGSESLTWVVVSSESETELLINHQRVLWITKAISSENAALDTTNSILYTNSSQDSTLYRVLSYRGVRTEIYRDGALVNMILIESPSKHISCINPS